MAISRKNIISNLINKYSDIKNKISNRNQIKNNTINTKSIQYKPELTDTSPTQITKKDVYGITNSIKIIYTCITNSYDVPKVPNILTHDWRYILFTDNPNLKVSNWEVIYIDNPEKLDSTKLARKVKTLYWEYLPEHDLNIWIDANVTIKNDLNDFCNTIMDNKHRMWITKHPQRQCVYQEATACIRLKKDSPEIINKQISSYKNNSLPKNIGLVESNVMLRKNTTEIKEIMTLWFKEIKTYSRRDQLSFNYIIWKHNKNSLVQTFNKKIRDRYLLWQGGHKK